LGSVENGVTDPTENGGFAGESSSEERMGSVGSVDSSSSSISKKKKIGRKRKSSRKRTDPTDPTRKKRGESGVDKPNRAGSVEAEITDPEPTPNGGELTPQGTGYTEVTAENVADYLRELEEE
jgi:hypothetical protein